MNRPPDRPETPSRDAAVTAGEHIRAARRRRGLSLRQLAAAAGMSHQMVHKYECDQVACPPVVRLAALATALDIPLATLVGESIVVLPQMGGGFDGRDDITAPLKRDFDLILDRLPDATRRRVAAALGALLADLADEPQPAIDAWRTPS